MEELNFLKEQNVDPGLVAQVREFREKYPVSEKAAHRIVKPSIPFFGREILEMSIAALLKGENLLLTGRRRREKMSWLRTWRIFSTARPTTYLFM